MLCPNCDGILNAVGCQACGWKSGDAVTRNETAFPYNARADYPHRMQLLEPPRIIEEGPAEPEPAPPTGNVTIQ